MLRLVKFGLILGAVAALAVAGWLMYFATTPLEVPADSRQFTLRKGRSIKGLSNDLTQARVLREPWSFAWLARILRRAGDIQAGRYELPPRVTPHRLLEMIVNGEVMQTRLTFIEGWTFAQMRAALDADPLVEHETARLSDAQILQRIGAVEPHPEGLFFPDTYTFAAGASDLQVLAQAYAAMKARLGRLWAARDRAVPYRTPYEGLIMASIVEKETGLESEREMIAAVFVNRLQLQMRLQTDPSVIYGLGKSFDGNLRKHDLETDTPYNTYTRAGLPPTPIAMPGRRALEAAFRPAATRALYFVSRGDGSSEFSATLQDHNRAVRRYQLGGR
jgi:UPF0755 protein